MYRIVCVFKACYWLSVNLVPARQVHGYTGALYVNACVHDPHIYSVYMCMYTYTYDCTVYTCVCTYSRIYTSTYVQCILVYVYVHICTVHTCVCIRTHMTVQCIHVHTLYNYMTLLNMNACLVCTYNKEQNRSN